MPVKRGVNKAKEKKKVIKIVRRYDPVKSILHELKKDEVHESNSEVTFENRPELKKYMGFGNLDFHAIYGHQSTLIDGTPVACLLNLRDPLNHDILTDHVWVRISLDTVSKLNHLKKGQPVRVNAKVANYHGEKVGLRVAFIALVKGQRNYSISSVRIEDSSIIKDIDLKKSSWMKNTSGKNIRSGSENGQKEGGS